MNAIKENQIKSVSIENIVFFDGHCILCNGFVDFLIRKDKQNNLKFASLQGETAKNFLPMSKISNIDTVVFAKKNEVFIKSGAVIQVFNMLGGIWKVLIAFLIIPKFLRDYIYDFIANNRYRWFGKRDTCRLPTTDEKEKILP